MRRAVTAALTVLLAVLSIPAAPAAAASNARVVIVVGPVGSSNAHYKEDAEAIAVEARRYSSDVVKLTTPTATWARVRAAAQGASIFVYLGHGNGWPSPYPPFQTLTKDGLGLDPSVGADGTRTVYYGEDFLRDNIRLAPNSVVLLFHLCYASGNTEPGQAQGTVTESRQRVDNYGAGFIAAGARAVFAEGHPSHPATDYVRQLFTTSRTMEQVFRVAPSRHGHVLGPYLSVRTPGVRFLMDPDTATPSGFYRSVIGDLDLTTADVTGPLPARTDMTPADFVIPGAAEVAGQAGSALFDTAALAADPAATGSSALPMGTRLRLTAEAAPMPDGTRVFAATALGSATSGYVRATELTPRDSAGVEVWTLDRGSTWLSPNGDGINDGLVIAVRLSESASTGLLVRNGAGASVWSTTIAGDMVRFTWNLRTSAGAVIPDGTYTWTMRSRDGWGNEAATETGSFAVDGSPPLTTASAASTAGQGGWSVSTATLTLASTDAISGVGAIQWRVDGGAVKTYADPAAVTASGTRLFEYRAVDRAGVVEPWHAMTLRIDTVPPEITITPSGTRGTADGTWRGPVTVTLGASDPISGLGTTSIVVDGGAPVAADGTPVLLQGEGGHTVTMTATDIAGNQATSTAAFLIDTVAPVVALPAAQSPSPAIPTVTPNGDAMGESLAVPYAVSEAATVTAIVTNAAGAVVRTITANAVAGTGGAEWDGRSVKGVPVPDGRYAVTLTATDPAGNVSTPVSTPIDVYSALTSVSRTLGLFYPQDGDALAPTSAVTFRLLTAARVSIDIVNVNGDVVRRVWADRAVAAGNASWSWNGRLANGAWAPRGTYRLLVRASNGEQAATGVATVIADAYRTVTSTTSPARGSVFTITAVTAERLSTTPRVTVRQPGLAAWSVTMKKVGPTTWKASIRPKAGGKAGSMSLTIQAKDAKGATNGKILRLVLR